MSSFGRPFATLPKFSTYLFFEGFYKLLQFKVLIPKKYYLTYGIFLSQQAFLSKLLIKAMHNRVTRNPSLKL